MTTMIRSPRLRPRDFDHWLTPFESMTVMETGPLMERVVSQGEILRVYRLNWRWQAVVGGHHARIVVASESRLIIAQGVTDEPVGASYQIHLPRRLHDWIGLGGVARFGFRWVPYCDCDSLPLLRSQRLDASGGIHCDIRRRSVAALDQ